MLGRLPAEPFDPATLLSVRVDLKSRVCVRQAYYSVPARLAGRRLPVRLTARTVEVFDGTRPVACHPRSLHKNTEQLVLDHYLEVLTGLPEAVTAMWPQTVVQTCVIHLLRNSFRYASRKDWPALAKDLKPVYTAPTEAAALARLADFADTWEARYPAIVKLWENSWAGRRAGQTGGGLHRVAPRRGQPADLSRVW